MIICFCQNHKQKIQADEEAILKISSSNGPYHRHIKHFTVMHSFHKVIIPCYRFGMSCRMFAQVTRKKRGIFPCAGHEETYSNGALGSKQTRISWWNCGGQIESK